MNFPDDPMKTFLVSVLALSLVSILGCTAPTVMNVEEVPQRHIKLTDQYALFDNASELAKSLYLEEVLRDPDAVPTVVQFNVRNTSNKPTDFMYRCKWVDGNGIELSFSTDTWINRTLLGKEKMNLRCPAPNKEASDYRLVFRRWKRLK